mmetsp:Transcript_35675/g.42603  ORF Transcript_35675/g.42603 Transcript_35675/m.42603 type:complete len:165 (-) Transcript_35675:36-530(-)
MKLVQSTLLFLAAASLASGSNESNGEFAIEIFWDKKEPSKAENPNNGESEQEEEQVKPDKEDKVPKDKGPGSKEPTAKFAALNKKKAAANASKNKHINKKGVKKIEQKPESSENKPTFKNNQYYHNQIYHDFYVHHRTKEEVAAKAKDEDTEKKDENHRGNLRK